MTQANLTETLFKPRFKHPETSTLVRRFNPGIQPAVQSALDGKNVPHWYRMINRLMWIWRGIDPREILDVQARIVMSESERTDSELYDTVVGDRVLLGPLTLVAKGERLPPDTRWEGSPASAVES